MHAYIAAARAAPVGVALAYLAGASRAEGGVPRQGSRFYIQLSQKDRSDLAQLESVLAKFGIPTGRLHMPRAAVDPDYWRFYVSARGHRRFAEMAGSWHPLKGPILENLRTRAAGPAGRAASYCGTTTLRRP